MSKRSVNFERGESSLSRVGRANSATHSKEINHSNTLSGNPRQRVSLLSSSLEIYHQEGTMSQSKFRNIKSSVSSDEDSECGTISSSSGSSTWSDYALNSNNLAVVASKITVNNTKTVEQSVPHRFTKKRSARPQIPRRLRMESMQWRNWITRKQVSFARNTLIIPQAPANPSPPASAKRSQQSSTTVVPVNSTKFQGPTYQNLNVALLSKVKRFLAYAGCLYNNEPNSKPGILFKVELMDGRTEIIQCGRLIYGQPRTMTDAFALHKKVRYGKNLVSEEDWWYIKHRFGFSKDTTMEFVWLKKMKNGDRRTSQTTPVEDYSMSGALQDDDQVPRGVIGVLKRATAKVANSLWSFGGAVFRTSS
ncbi:hypothetical protein BJY04DRAFT_219685 [Aspergillus karnatakaensis]|uniref:uncharacterized protein n=1 Tax=Aspergillus karnatakaensis TaxID=1810916 RepID=UPI003CCD4C92